MIQKLKSYINFIALNSNNEITITPSDSAATVDVTGLPTGVSYTDGKITGTPEVTDWDLVEETRDIKVTVVTTNEDGSKITKEVVITVLRDTDEDGTPDTTDEDDDNDGYTDAEEIEKGSDPKDPNSIPQMVITPIPTVSITPLTQEVTEGNPIEEVVITPADTNATVEVTGLPTGLTYADGKITGTPEVTDWDLVEETRDIKVTVVITNEDGSKITKEVVITVLRDTDKDGTPDTTDEDDDNDGFTDVEENEKGSDPKDPNSIPQTETETEAEIETETEVETPVETETEKETDKEKPVDEGNEHNPNTGDNFNSVVYIGLASVALIALVIMRKNNLQN